MKKLLFIFAVLGLVLISCEKESPAPNTPTTQGEDPFNGGDDGGNPVDPVGGDDENSEIDDLGREFFFLLRTNIPVTSVDSVVIYSNPYNNSDAGYISGSVVIGEDVINTIYAEEPNLPLILTRIALSDEGIKFRPLMVDVEVNNETKKLYSFIGSYIFTIFVNDGSNVQDLHDIMKDDIRQNDIMKYGLNWPNNNNYYFEMDVNNNTITFSGSF